MIPEVAASETGGAQTRQRCRGLKGRLPARGGVRNFHYSRKVLGKPDREGEIPVSEMMEAPMAEPEYGGARETLPEAGSTTIQG